MKRGVSYRPQLDQYSQLWNSLEMKPETARVAGILSSDMDLTAQKHLTGIWRRNLRDLASVSRITGAVSSSHSKNAVRIWDAAFTAVAQQGEDLSSTYDDLRAKLGEVPRSTVAIAIEHILNKGGTFDFLNRIPKYVLQRLVDENIRFWAQAADPQQLGLLVVPLARRGIFPQQLESVNALNLLRRPVRLRYIEATTEVLNESQTCSGITAALCCIFIKWKPPLGVLKCFFEACLAAKQPAIKRHPVTSTSVVSALYAHKLKSVVSLVADKSETKTIETDGAHKISSEPTSLAPMYAQPANTVYQAYHNIVNAPQGPPLAIVQLYANWLRCCARDTPHDLLRFHETAREAVAELEGGLKPGRERVLLSGIAQGLVASKNWKLLASFAPQITCKTKTPYLWNAALVATRDWSVAEQMKARSMLINRHGMYTLLNTGELSDLKRLLPLVDTLPQGILAAFLQRAIRKNVCGYSDLIKFYRQVFETVYLDLKQKHVVYPFIDTEVVEAVVWGALRTNPKSPWKITPLLAELVDSKLAQTHSVAEGISQALQNAQQGEDGTAKHIRNHLAVSGEDLAKRFNSEWKASTG